jgi:hypothetical protein
MHSIWLHYWKEDTLGKTFKWRSKTLHYKYISGYYIWVAYVKQSQYVALLITYTVEKTIANSLSSQLVVSYSQPV